MVKVNVLDELTKLSKAELDEVIKHAKGLMQFAGTGVPMTSIKRGTDPYDWILGECANVCKAHGLSMLDVEALKAGRLYKAGFHKPIIAVHEYVEGFAKGRLQQRALYRLVYEYMATEYRWGPPRMVASTSLIPRLLNEMLPGYYHAGLMGVAMDRMNAKGNGT